VKSVRAKPVREEAVGANQAAAVQDVQDLLGCLLFRGAEVLKPVAVLSAGERIRLGLARLPLGARVSVETVL